MIKRSLFRVARTRWFAAFVDLLERGSPRQTDLLRVLTYHRVDWPDARPDLDPGMISATPDEFAAQLKHLATNYRVVRYEQVLRAIQGHTTLPERSVLITFDDAYEDFAEHAWPLLRQWGLPAMLFVPTAYPDAPGRGFWWDRLYQALCRRPVDPGVWEAAGIEPRDDDPYGGFRRLARRLKRMPHAAALELVDDVCRRQDVAATNPVLGWSELRELANSGLTLGAHTCTHPLLNRLPVEEAVDEARNSYRELQQHVGEAPRAFAYPGGAFSAEVVEALRDSFDVAFTTCRGINDLRRADYLRLRRINVGRQTPPALVRAQLLADARVLNFCWPLKSAV